MMPFEVFITDDAAGDLEGLFNYVAANDAPEKAEFVLGQIEKVLNALAEFPERGTFPKELLSVGVREYREVFFKPYRIIYRVIGTRVYIYLIADGRRDMQSLLQRRLLGA